MASIQALLENLTRDTQNQLQLQGRTIVEMQNGLMRTRMVSFQRHAQRLSRIVRQTAVDEEKQAELIVEGATGELDRQVLERMLPPFEHLLRNAVVHGIEKPAQRAAAGKSETGQIRLQLRREGAEVIVDVRDDGAGMNIGRIKSKALSLGLITEGQQLTDEEAMQLILEPGFSTAENLTQAAGRGVGMDVVANEVKKLGGSLLMETEAGKGSRFMIRLPLSLSVGHAVILRVGDEQYALPMPTIEGVVRIAREEVQEHLLQSEPSYVYGGYKYRLQHLAGFVGLDAGPLPEEEPTLPVVLVRAGELSTGVVAEEMLGTREIVVKPVGPQIAGIRGVSGATILGDGRIVVILDMGQLVRTGLARPHAGHGDPRATGSPHRRAGGGRFHHRAPRDAAPARAQWHARAHRARWPGRAHRDGRKSSRRGAARHRDAAHGRLPGGRVHARRCAPEARAHHHDHLARGREASCARHGDRRGRIPSASRTRKASCSRPSCRWWIARAPRAPPAPEAAEKHMAQDLPGEIYGLLVPLEKDQLLVPRGCVAEVIGYQTPQEMTGAPPWHLGVVRWNDRQVPLVSFEGCAGGEIAPPTQRSRVVVLNALSEKLPGAIAILSQGFPKLVRISPEFVKLDAQRSFPEDGPIVCQIQLLDETRWCPTSTVSNRWWRRKRRCCPRNRRDACPPRPSFTPALDNPYSRSSRRCRRSVAAVHSMPRPWRNAAAGRGSR